MMTNYNYVSVHHTPCMCTWIIGYTQLSSSHDQDAKSLAASILLYMYCILCIILLYQNKNIHNNIYSNNGAIAQLYGLTQHTTGVCMHADTHS